MDGMICSRVRLETVGYTFFTHSHTLLRLIAKIGGTLLHLCCAARREDSLAVCLLLSF